MRNTAFLTLGHTTGRSCWCKGAYSALPRLRCCSAGGGYPIGFRGERAGGRPAEPSPLRSPIRRAESAARPPSHGATGPGEDIHELAVRNPRAHTNLKFPHTSTFGAGPRSAASSPCAAAPGAGARAAARAAPAEARRAG